MILGVCYFTVLCSCLVQYAAICSGVSEEIWASWKFLLNRKLIINLTRKNKKAGAKQFVRGNRWDDITDIVDYTLAPTKVVRMLIVWCLRWLSKIRVISGHFMPRIRRK